MMDATTIALRDRILLALLPDVAFDGWTWDGARRAAVGAGLDAGMADAVFPGGLPELLSHFADWADRQMLDHLNEEVTAPLRIRDKVREAVLVRLQALEPWHEQAKLAARYWAAPYRAADSARLLWRTADKIWDWAGDTATDYNRYTKRGLLVGVLASTMVVWLANDDSDGRASRMAGFVERRIDRVLRVGKFAARFKRGEVRA